MPPHGCACWVHALHILCPWLCMLGARFAHPLPMVVHAGCTLCTPFASLGVLVHTRRILCASFVHNFARLCVIVHHYASMYTLSAHFAHPLSMTLNACARLCTITHRCARFSACFVHSLCTILHPYARFCTLGARFVGAFVHNFARLCTTARDFSCLSMIVRAWCTLCKPSAQFCISARSCTLVQAVCVFCTHS